MLGTLSGGPSLTFADHFNAFLESVGITKNSVREK
jgi:hypothetical protein